MSTREQFEKWCESEGINATKSDVTGVYSFPSARVAWRSWKASRAEAMEKMAELCDANADQLKGGVTAQGATALIVTADTIRALAKGESE